MITGPTALAFAAAFAGAAFYVNEAEQCDRVALVAGQTAAANIVPRVALGVQPVRRCGLRACDHIRW